MLCNEMTDEEVKSFAEMEKIFANAKTTSGLPIDLKDNFLGLTDCFFTRLWHSG